MKTFFLIYGTVVSVLFLLYQATYQDQSGHGNYRSNSSGSSYGGSHK